MAYENIAVERRGKVGVVTLDRPNALNALNSALVAERGQALAEFGSDLLILLGTPDGSQVQETSLSELLPGQFDPSLLA